LGLCADPRQQDGSERQDRAVFPYLDLGDSDRVCAGERIYTLSNALGQIDNITDGILSNTGRNVDDPDYLSIQMSAPISTGSSGGALLNRFGEVIGIIYAMFANSQNMNLAVPINVIASEKRVGDGISLSEVKRIEDEKKAAATLSLSQTELEMEYGEEREILVTIEGPGSANLKYQIDSSYVVDCEWKGFQTKRTAALIITAVGDGEAEVNISFVEDGYDEEYSAVIHVTVTGTPEEPEEEELPTGVTERE
jgi:S1-C subfamily serine protease